MHRTDGKASRILYVHRSRGASDEQVVFYLESALNHIKIPDNLVELEGNSGCFYRVDCYIPPREFYVLLQDELDEKSGESRVVMNDSWLHIRPSSTRNGDPENTTIHDRYPQNFADWILRICDPLRDTQEEDIAASLPSYRVEKLHEILSNWWDHTSGDGMRNLANTWGAARERNSPGNRYCKWSWETDLPYWTWMAIEQWLCDYCDYKPNRRLTLPK